MAGSEACAELVQHIDALTSVRRGIQRSLPSDYHPAGVVVLSLLHTHGELRTNELSEHLNVDLSVTSRHVTHLAERGWVERVTDPKDRRCRVLRLTTAGEEALEHAGARWRELLNDLLRDWSDDEVTMLTRLLGRLRTSFDDGQSRVR